ncbi:MAG TPA: TIGR02452 family protein [Spirochaetales bacterium]|nr:TIGR02452 family protein [Spirochaetales bacterium]
MATLKYLPCLDSEELAAARKRDLDLDRRQAQALGQSAVAVSRDGHYVNQAGQRVDIGDAVRAAVRNKLSIAPDAVLDAKPPRFAQTLVQVGNETTLGAASRLVRDGGTVLALNFANGVYPGGGFLNGARAQEEFLCRSSALYLTLEGDSMYTEHAARPTADSTDWAILSPNVPVFRGDDGRFLDEPYLLGFVTCAAPVASSVGLARSAALMRERIRRVLAIASAHGYDSLVLGAWGCGAFGNDTLTTARQFKEALDGDYAGAFRAVAFAVTDWSSERRFLGVFRDVFSD